MDRPPRKSAWERVSPWAVTGLALALAGLCTLAAPAIARPSVPGLPAHPSRIVALGLPADELVLGLVAPDRVVALDRFTDNPRASNVVDEARSVAARLPVSAEAIAAVNPNLVLLPAWSGRDLDTTLHRFGIATLRLSTPSTLDDVREGVRSAARALDASDRGEAVVRDLDASLARTRARASAHGERPTVLVEAGSGLSPGGGTLLSELVSIAGGELLLARRGETGLVPLSLERELSLDPDVLVVDPYRADARAHSLGDAAHDGAGLDIRASSLRAVREGRVRPMEARLLLTTTHHVAATAEALFEALHR